MIRTKKKKIMIIIRIEITIMALNNDVIRIMAISITGNNHHGNKIHGNNDHGKTDNSNNSQC